MAKAVAQKNYFEFVKGLITEASPLNAIENSSFDEDNFDLRRDGTRKRRRGIDFENGGATPALTQTHTAAYYATHTTSTHEWRSIGGTGTNNKTILQMGNFLYLLGLDTAVVSTGGAGITFDNTAIGGGAADTAIDMSLVAVAAADTGVDKVQISFGKGVAFVVSPTINPFLIEYHATTGNYSTHYIGTTAGNIRVRDFAGLDDGLAVDTRPAFANWAALTAGNPAHAYNLLNQGWTQTHVALYTNSGVAPANSDVWWYGKNSTGIFTPAEMNKMWFGSMRGARGRFIYPAFNMTRTTYVAGIANLVTNARPSVTIFYSGRAWYTGIQDSAYSGTILYSKLIEEPTQDAHICHMEADPTSEIVSDLVATDGGTITIPEAGQIVKLVVSSTGLLVFAQNGVWHIRGTADTGFSATGFSVRKITNVGTDSVESIVEVEGNIMYWSRSGIYLIHVDPNTAELTAQNVSQSTIQAKVNAVSNASLALVKGVYDPLEREVKWCYSENVDVNNPDYCNKTLTLDIVLEAWYTGTISGVSATDPYIVSLIQTLNMSSVAPDYKSMVRYITFKQATPTSMQVYISTLYQDNMMDWFTNDGVGLDYTSYIETSYELLEDAMRSKYIDEMHLFFQRTEDTVSNGVLDNPSGCLMQYKFDWADDESSGLFTKQEQAYKFPRPMVIPVGAGPFPFNYGQSVIVSKHNVRGSGRAFQLRLESETGKDMHVLGWASFTSGNTR